MGLLHFQPGEWPGLLGSPIGQVPPQGPTAPMFVPPTEAGCRDPVFGVDQNNPDSPSFPRPGFTPFPPGIFDEWRKHAERGLMGIFNTYFRDTSKSDDGGGDPDQPGCEEEWKAARQDCTNELAKRYPNKKFTGGHKNVEDCPRGLVSARCGGNSR
jgi:hypothetical protein